MQACDALGNPIRFILTGGEASDYTQALALLDGAKAAAVLADKGYDADYVVNAAPSRGSEVVISSKSHHHTPRSFESSGGLQPVTTKQP